MDLDSNNVVLSNLYKKYFEKYLLTKVDFVQYDNMLKNSKLDFGDLDFKINLKSHLDEFLNTNHFFILNRFCVKKLSENELNILNSGNEENIFELIKSTFREVIKDNYIDNKYVDNLFKINYLNSLSNEGYFDNDSLVIAIYYGKNKETYNTKEEFLDNYSKKQIFLKELSNQIKKEINEKLDLKCDVFFSKM